MAPAHPYPSLARIVLSYPAIDNHTHPLLIEGQRDALPFEQLVSEASGASAANIPHTLVFHNATARLSELYGLPPFLKTDQAEMIAAHPPDPETVPEIVPGIGPDSSWAALKAHRAKTPYEELCRRAMNACHLETMLFDDGLDGVKELCAPRDWHDRFARSPCKRIVRIETVAQDILSTLFADLYRADRTKARRPDRKFCVVWLTTVIHSLRDALKNPDVVGFKSVVCYRTGLAVDPLPAEIVHKLQGEAKDSTAVPKIRIEHKSLNDVLVGIVMAISAIYHKPVQFHTGLGDSDIVLANSSPAFLQPLINANPNGIFVLLHCSYPYSREAAYLCSMYENVYLDFGEIFAMISGDGCREVISQILELAPSNKIMWSSDGHWWPESFYLGSLMAREALLEVLTSSIRTSRLPLSWAVQLAKDALFNTANRVYDLRLTPPEF
ncbi:amidohydrolase 2 [Vararia minispora EC-137]|uniref:Amidohydrolase 2 n=1 Tax=Vararia minispora EC-137 TaxID=1314806 RepID=A0ACB8QTV8_9AGAM|nr:amidohydrolase 2 [Vararia minispora EC-137]